MSVNAICAAGKHKYLTINLNIRIARNINVLHFTHLLPLKLSFSVAYALMINANDFPRQQKLY